MSELEYNIRPLQEEALKIFKVFAAICDKHGLRYYAAYGTALGAIRHNGFIPWDDDFDVAMPREDYELVKGYLKDELPCNLKFVDWKNSKGLAPLTFGKIQNGDRKLVEEVEKSIGHLLPQGIYIDVFPLDGVPCGKWKLLSLKLRIILLLAAESSLNGIFAKCSIKSWCWRLLGSVVRKYWYGISKLEDVAKAREVLANRYRFDESNNCGCLYGPYGIFRESYDYNVYGEGRVVQFEDTSIIVPANSDVYLKLLYGDYMQLPPLEKRRPTHSDVPSVPWKFGPDR